MTDYDFVYSALLKIDKDAAKRFVKGALANPGGLFLYNCNNNNNYNKKR